MSKSRNRQYKRFDDEEEYGYDSDEYQNRKKEKRIKNSLRARNISDFYDSDEYYD